MYTFWYNDVMLLKRFRNTMVRRSQGIFFHKGPVMRNSHALNKLFNKESVDLQKIELDYQSYLYVA